MSHRRFRAAVVQTYADLGDLPANIERTRRHVDEAVRQGAQLVVLPECMNSGYLFDSLEHARTLAEPVNGHYGQALAELARTHGIHIGAGLTELGDDGLIYNSAILFDPQGELIGCYRKQFLPAQDQNWFSVGDTGMPVFDTALGRIGMLVCFDGRIPEVSRCLAASGAEVILDMANFFVMGQADQWVPARAMENGVWFLAATKAGVERSIYYPGGSLIVAPTGEVRARIANDTEGIACAEIELDAQAACWADGTGKWADRQPQAYTLLTQPFESTSLAPLLAKTLQPEACCVKVGAVQAHADRTHSVDDLLTMARHAALLGTKLLALPLYAGADRPVLDAAAARALAERTPALVDALHALCAEHDALVVLPSVEADAHGLHPSALLIGPQGVIRRQHQVHLGAQERSWAAAASTGLQVFDTPHGRIGLLLGTDGLFPESTRVLALQGADIVVWASAWSHPDERRLLTATKAADNRVYLVCANRADAPAPGGSFVVPPSGLPHWDLNVNAPANPRWGAVMPLYAELALARQKCMEPGVDMLRNRLPGTYGVLTTPQPPVLSHPTSLTPSLSASHPTEFHA
jgi:predicted amidohydrolase